MYTHDCRGGGFRTPRLFNYVQTYLHNCTPAIIHRQLTAENVLLISVMVAKIADMGNAHIVIVQSGQFSSTTTAGMIVYMPPEAFELPPK